MQTGVINAEKGTYLNFEFYTKHNKFLTTEVEFNKHAMTKAFVKQMLIGPNGFFSRTLKGKKVQDYVVFTYDDFQLGQKQPPYPKPPNHITAIREGRWKLAKYHDVPQTKRKKKPPQWEMYDLQEDPLETENIAHSSYERSPAQEAQLQRLKRKLARVEKQRLEPLPS